MFFSIPRVVVGSLLLASITQPSFSKPDLSRKLYITMGTDLSQKVFKQKSNKVLEIGSELSVLEIDIEDMGKISHEAHEAFHRCGGFMVHESYESAQAELHNDSMRNFAKNISFADYTINQSSLVSARMAEAEEIRIRKMIQKLSSFKNRYFESQTGLESQEYIFNEWKKIGSGRSDIEVTKFKHSSWPQDSIVAVMKGASEEKIIIGGHADSVAGWWNRSGARAPGADDNASGIATITETFRVLVESGYRPQKTLVFAAYAAEEVGLRGSKDMAETYKRENETVLGVLQLDMTNYNGSDWDIALVSDYTNEEQNKFLGGLIDTYLPNLKWGYDRCGYACSDHASWTGQGFPASAPFEARKSKMNPHIHTSRDTLSQSNDNANHALKFAKLALAYVIELDN